MKINAENKELIIRNSRGDVAIIPSKYRLEVQGMIKDGCHECIDDLVSRLPVMEDYAAEGSVVPNPELPPDYERFLAYNKTAPENRRPHEGWTYGDPNEYDHYGMWEAIGKPDEFYQGVADYNADNPDNPWVPDEDGFYHGFSVNPYTGVWLKPFTPGVHEEGSTAWMEANGHYLSRGANTLALVYDPDLGRMRYIPKTQ